MVPIKLFDAEIKLMTLLWTHGSLPAKDLAVLAHRNIGWNKNTTYTIANKLAAKGALLRKEPNFLCEPLITREQALHTEADSLIERYCRGSIKQFLLTYLSESQLSWWELDELSEIIAALKADQSSALDPG